MKKTDIPQDTSLSQHKNTKKILVNCYQVEDYMLVLEIQYFDKEIEYTVTSFVDHIEILEDEQAFKEVVAKIIMACKIKRNAVVEPSNTVKL